MIPGFYPRISFQKLFLGDLTEGEGTREARGILLPGHDAVLDGFFDHLQGTNTGIKAKTLHCVNQYCIIKEEKSHYLKFIKLYFKRSGNSNKCHLL